MRDLNAKEGSVRKRLDAPAQCPIPVPGGFPPGREDDAMQAASWTIWSHQRSKGMSRDRFSVRRQPRAIFLFMPSAARYFGSFRDAAYLSNCVVSACRRSA